MLSKTIQQNFTAEQHGKGACSLAYSNQSARTICSLTLLIFTSFLEGVWDAEGGGGKTGAESAALHGFEMNTTFDFYNYLKQQYSTVTNSYHESLCQTD